MRFFALTTLWICLYSVVKAQSSYIPLGSYSMHILDRMEIKQGRLATPDEFNTTTKAYQRHRIAHYADSFNTDSTPLSPQDLFNLQYLKDDNFEFSSSTATLSKKYFKKSGIYKHKAALFDVQIPDFTLVVNPVLYLKNDYDQQLSDKRAYLINRGIEIRGTLSKSISFYTQISEEIHKMNTWNLEYYREHGVIAGQNLIYTAGYTLGANPILNYWSGSGYIVYQPNKYWDLQFGHGQNNIGDGYRSLMRSNFASNSLFMRSNVRIWKINYTNIWGSLYDYKAPIFAGRDQIVKRHYYATTHASINITKRLNIGLFETTVFQRDSGYEKQGYDLQYLNPIIFYNLIEDALNSPDKNILGLNFKYNFAKHVSVYGQAVISELNFDNRLSKKGWWGNKECYQIGIKYIDMFNLSNIDLQLEYNQANPYSYTSFDARNAYVNYNQSMAHPYGANFREGIGIIRYQPKPKLFITATFMYSIFGNDTNGSNWGKDITLSYITHPKEYGNYIGQGITTKLYINSLMFSLMFKHNLFFDVQFTYRNQTSELAIFESKTYNASVALRWNIAMRQCDF